VKRKHNLPAGSDGVRKAVDGGDPIYLDSPITLCGRMDLNATRFFSGRLAELSVFDAALTPTQVAYLHAQGIAGMRNVSAPRAHPSRVKLKYPLPVVPQHVISASTVGILPSMSQLQQASMSQPAASGCRTPSDAGCRHGGAVCCQVCKYVPSETEKLICRELSVCV